MAGVLVCLQLVSQPAAADVVVNSGARITMTTSTIKNNGNWTINAGGNFAQGTGTVVLNPGSGTKSMTTSGTEFYNLTVAGAGGTQVNLPDSNLTVNGRLTATSGTLAFDNDKNLAVDDDGATGTAVSVAAAGALSNTGTGDLTIGAAVANAGAITFDASGGGGGSADDLLIRSSVNGTQRNWQGAGTFTMTDVDVKDQTAIGGTPASISTTSSTNSGNNINWFFGGGVNISGAVYNGKAEAGTLATRDLRIVHYNGTVQTSYTTTTDGAGAFTVSMTTLASGDTVVIYLDDEAEEGTLVYVSDGNTVANLKVYQNAVAIRTDAASATNAGLSAADNADDDIKYNVAAGAATFESAFELFIFSGSTYAPAGSVTAGSVDLNGTLTLAANTLNVSGSFDATGGSFTTTGTTNFTAAAGTVDIISDGDAFHHVVFNDGGGGATFELEDAFDANGNLTITAGTLDTKAAENNSMAVGGNWSNSGSFVSNSNTVTFDGGSAQTIDAGGTGSATKDFNNITVSGSTLQLITTGLEVDGTLTIQGSKVVDLNGQALTLGTLDNSGTLQLEGGETVAVTAMDSDSGTVLYDGTASVTIPAFTTAYFNLTFDESGTSDPTYTLPDSNLTVNGVFSVADGTVTFDNDKNLTVNDNGVTGTAISVAAAGVLTNSGTGDLTLKSAVTNAGTITFNSSDDAGNGITIASSDGATQRNWQGAGTFTMTDVTVSYQNCTGGTPAFIFVSSGTNSGNNTNWFFGGGTLTATNVQPASLVAGAESDVTVSFTLANGLPANGKVVIDFPSGFNAAALSAVTNALALDGGWSVTLADGDGTNDVVTLTRDGTGTLIAAGTAVSLVLENEVRNPQISGSTGVYSIQTQTSTGAILDSAAPAADTITAGVLTATDVQPASLIMSSTNSVTISFTTANPIPSDGTIVVTFPTTLGAGFVFDSTGATALSGSTGLDGTITYSRAVNVVTFTRSAGTSSAAGAKTLTITNVENPNATGSTGVYQIKTTNSAAVTIDEDTAVSADTITAFGTASVPALLDSAGIATATYTLGSTTTGKIYPRITDTDENSNAATVQTVTATLTSAATGDSETVTLTETGANTGIFTGPAAGFSYDADDAAAANNGTLETRGGDTITLAYTDDDDGADATSVSATVQAGEGQVLVTLTASPTSVRIGDVVVFTATIKNQTAEALTAFKYVTQMPAGLTGRPGSASVDSGTFESEVLGSATSFTNFSDIGAGVTRTLTYQAVVGSSAQSGSFTVQSYVQFNPIISNTAQVTLQIRPDPVFQMGTLIGKVFWDINRNGVQDPGEDGIPNAVLATEQGYVMTTDEYGRYNIPDFLSGRHMVKIDRSSLPPGSKLTTAEAVVVNQTDAMLSKVNFGVLIPESSAHLFDQERDEDVLMTVQKDTESPKKYFDLQFHEIRKPREIPTQVSSRALEEISGGDYLLSADNPDRRLPFRIVTNYAQYVKNWKFEVVRVEREEGQLFTKDKVKDLKVVSVAEAEGVPTSGAFRYPWTHPWTDSEGEPIEYAVRVTLTGQKGGEDTLLYRITAALAADNGVRWTLERADQLESIRADGTSVSVKGKTHADTVVSLYGREMLTDLEGNFSYQIILPEGNHEIPVLLYMNGSAAPTRVIRSIDLTDTHLFFVGFSEYERGQMDIQGNILSVTEEDKARFNDTWYDEGRLAYYLKGKIKGKYLITASVDTDRHKRELFRNLEPEDFYPVYGDSSTVQADANDTQDSYYLLLEADKSYFKYGNFETGFTGTEFADFVRTLHGAKAHYESLATGPGGQAKTVVTLFAAKARQKAVHAEFAATGGSLYYLKHKDVIKGSEKLKVIVRDQVTGVPIQETPLAQGIDYSIDYDEGRIRLYRPVSSVTLRSDSILSSEPLVGNPQFVAVDYEYLTEAEDEVQARTVGARASHFVLDDVLRLGGTYVQEDRSFERYALTGADGTLYLPGDTVVTAETAQSTLDGTGNFLSGDGGLSFVEVDSGTGGRNAGARKIDLTSNPWEGAQIQSYYRQVDPFFSSAQSLTEAGTEKYGLGILQDAGRLGTFTMKHEVLNFAPDAGAAAVLPGPADLSAVALGAAAATVDNSALGVEGAAARSGSTTTLRHQWIWGALDFTEEVRVTDSEDLKENLVGAQAGYQMNDSTRFTASAQTDLVEEGHDQLRIGVEKKIIEGLTLLAEQSLGSQGPGTLVGIDTGLAAGGQPSRWSKGFGSLKLPEVEKPVVEETKPLPTEIGLKREFGNGNALEFGRTVGGEEADQKQVFKFSKATPDGRVLEMVQESTATSDSSSYNETTPMGPGSEKYQQNTTTTDKATGQQSTTQVKGMRAALWGDRATLFQEDSTSQDAASKAERIGRRMGGLMKVTDHTAVGANYERNQERLEGLTRDHHTAQLAVLHYDFERITLRDMWEYQRTDDLLTDTDQLVSYGDLELKLNPDWTLLARYEWAWTKASDAASVVSRDLARFTELQTGWAYRPTEHDRFNWIGEFKFLADEMPFGQVDLTNEQVNVRRVARTEFAYDLTPQITLVEKLALRSQEFVVTGQDRVESSTLLSAHRINLHLTDRWDVSGEWRLLSQSLADDLTTSYLGETSYRFFDTLRLSVGYSSSNYESNLARDLNVEVRGVYFRVFYDALQEAQNLVERRKRDAEAVAKQLERDMNEVSQFAGKERDIQEMKSRLAYAKKLMDRGLYDEAVEALQQGLELQQAAKRYSDRAESQKDRLDFYKSQGRLFLKHGMYERAFREFEKGYRINAFDTELLNEMSRARDELQRLRRVKRDIRRRQAREFKKLEGIADPGALLIAMIRVHHKYGQEYLMHSMPEEAIAEWVMGLDLLKKAESGDSAFSEDRKRVVEEVESIHRKAKEYLDAGDPEKAAEELKRGAEILKRV